MLVLCFAASKCLCRVVGCSAARTASATWSTPAVIHRTMTCGRRWVQRAGVTRTFYRTSSSQKTTETLSLKRRVSLPTFLLFFTLLLSSCHKVWLYAMAMSFCCLFVCWLKCILVGHWSNCPSGAGGHEQPQYCWASQASARHTDGGGGLLCWPFGAHWLVN